MAANFCCGFECGVVTASGAGSVGQHWALNGTAPNITFDTVVKRSGSRSMKFDALGIGRFLTPVVSVAGQTTIVLRFYIYFQTLPNVNLELVRCGDNTDTGIGYLRFIASSNGLRGRAGSNETPDYVVVAGQWYRVDFRFTCGSNPWTVDVSVDGNPLTQATNPVAASAVQTLRVGVGATSNTGVFNIDDFIMSFATGDFPFGTGYIHPFIPTADGTHNIAGTGDYQRTTTGTDILNTTTTAFQLIDDIPLESGAGTDWINMVAPPNATDYVECVFGPAPGISVPTVAPRFVEAICATRQSATGTGSLSVRLNDNGTNATIFGNSARAGTTTIVYDRLGMALNAFNGPWTVVAGNGNFNNLRVRFQPWNTVDANPDQYFCGIMIEAEFTENPIGKLLNIKQAVNRSNTY